MGSPAWWISVMVRGCLAASGVDRLELTDGTIKFDRYWKPLVTQQDNEPETMSLND